MVIRVREMSGKILPVVQVKIKSVQKQLDPRSGPGDSKLYTYPIFLAAAFRSILNTLLKIFLFAMLAK